MSLVVSNYVGWKLSEPQIKLFWRLMANAAKYQQWSNAEAEVQRRVILKECGFYSAKQIDPRGGFDRVKRRLEELAGMVHASPEDEAKRGRCIYKIGELLVDWNDVYGEKAETALQSLFKARFKVIPQLSTIGQLSTDELVNLCVTLEERIEAKRKEQLAQSDQAAQQEAQT